MSDWNRVTFHGLDADRPSPPDSAYGVNQAWVSDDTGSIYQAVVSGGALAWVATAALESAYAEIYVADGVTAQAIPTGATYTKLTGFATNGQSQNCTADAANDKITITRAGRYLTTVTISGVSTASAVTFDFAVFLDGVRQDAVNAHRAYAVGGDEGNCSMAGILNATSVPVDVDVRCVQDSLSSDDFTPSFMNLTVLYIGAA